MTVARAVSTDAANDHELIVAIANGDLAALGHLFERHESSLRRYLGRLGVAASEADDLVQSTFLAVVRAAPQFDPNYAARAWLLGIATMMVRRHRRTLRRTAAYLAAWAGLARSEVTPTPAEVFENNVRERRVAEAFQRLSDKKREVFVLVTLEGLSGEEAAATLGIPVNTVWTRLHHARRDLRAAIREGDE